MSGCFVGKPQFVIEKKGDRTTVFREDYYSQLAEVVAEHQPEDGQRLSVSEWEVFSKYHGIEPERPPVTMHDVFSLEGLTIKTGNPFRNNAFEEFHRALLARCAGIVEAKSPLGFIFWQNDIYGERQPGLMFYKHLNGLDLDKAIDAEDEGAMNWALWESGKFFSRLINAKLYLEDADRLNNYFIEKNAANRIFRFLDLERLHPIGQYTDKKKAEMITNFGRKAIGRGWLTQEKLGEFIIVALGADSPAADLVRQALEPSFS